MVAEITPAQALTLLQHGDSQFPSGAFAFSCGLEGMLDDDVTTAAALPALITNMLRCRWAPFDRVAVRLGWRAHADISALAALDNELEATLLAPAERSASTRAGAALLTTHLRLATVGAAALRASIDRGTLHGHRCLVEGAMWRAIGLEETQAALLSGFSFVNSLCTACVRLGRLGALGQQAIVTKLLPEIVRLADAPLGVPLQLRAFNPLAEIAMMRHPARNHTLFAN